MRIRVEDYIHTVTNPAEDDSHEVIVDNFLPYLDEVILTSQSSGEPVYQAGWKPIKDGTAPHNVN